MKISENAQKSIDRVIEKFKTGDISQITKVARLKIADNAPSNSWSLSNKVLAFLQADELDCRGYRQWLEAGRSIKKGSKAVYILVPHLIKKEDKETEEKKSVCVGFVTTPVFAASSTTGDRPLPEYEPVSLPPLFDVAKNMGISIEYLPIANNKLGDCKTDGSRIRLGTHEQSIFFHELAHAIHAKINNGLKEGQNKQQEIIAEFTSCVLMDLYEFGDSSGNAWEYISSYSSNPLIAITKALSTVEKVLQVINQHERSK